MAFARAQGRNPTLQEAVQLARSVGWTEAQGMAGPQSEVTLLSKLGVGARMAAPDPRAIIADVQAGNPVILDTPLHYFVVDGYNADSGQFHVGASGTAFKRGSTWLSLDGMARLAGAVRAALFIDSATSAAPSVVAGGSAPPPSAGPGGPAGDLPPDSGPYTGGGPGGGGSPQATVATGDATSAVAATPGPSRPQQAPAPPEAYGYMPEPQGSRVSDTGIAPEGPLAGTPLAEAVKGFQGATLNGTGVDATTQPLVDDWLAREDARRAQRGQPPMTPEERQHEGENVAGSVNAGLNIGMNAPEGMGRFYHGTGAAFETPRPSKFDPEAMYGPGYYMTSEPRVAESYAEVAKTPTRDWVLGEIQKAEQSLATAPASDQNYRSTMERHLQGLRELLDDPRVVNGPPSAGPNIRPADVPTDLNLLDADARVTQPTLDGITAAIRRLGPDSNGRLGPVAADRFVGAYAEEARYAGRTGDTLHRVLASTVGPDWANMALAQAGYDGVRYRGGRIMPIQDAAGNPIEHTALNIFPESLGKIRNALSGKAGGTVSSQLALHAAGAGLGGAAGYESAPQDASPLELAGRTAAGAALGTLGVHYVANLPRYYAANLLSSPSTNVKILGSGLVSTLANAPERVVSGLLNKGLAGALGAERGRYAGEAGPLLYGYARGVGGALAQGWDVLAHGSNAEDVRQLVGGGAHAELPGGAFNPANVIFRSHQATYTFFSKWNEAAQLSALAYREGRQFGLGGRKLGQYIDRALTVPSPTLAAEAERLGKYTTYRQAMDGLGRGLTALRDFAPGGLPVGRFVMPFVNIPYNVLKWNLERSPLAALPIASDLARGTYSTGDAEAVGRLTDKLARFLFGTSVATAAGYLYEQGKITGDGPTDPARRSAWLANHQPNSFMGPDGQWHSYLPIPAVGLTMKLTTAALDMIHEAARNPRAPDVQGRVADASVQAFGSIAQGVADESFMQGWGNLWDAIHQSGGQMSKAVTNYGENTAAGLVPFSAGLTRAARILDPTVRQPDTALQSVERNIPGLSQNVPPRIDIFTGKPMTRDLGPLDFFNPIQHDAPQGDTTAQQTLDLGAKIPGAGSKLGNQDLTPDQRRRYEAAFGQARTALLGRLYASPEWAGKSEAEQRKLAEAAEAEAGTQARAQVEQEMGIHPDHPPMVMPAAVPADIRAKYPDGYALDAAAREAQKVVRVWRDALRAGQHPPQPPRETLILAGAGRSRTPEYRAWATAHKAEAAAFDRELVDLTR